MTVAGSNSFSRLRVAVTGASGYLGQALCRRLLEHPWVDLVVGLDLASWPHPEILEKDRFEFYRTDINDPDLADRLVGLDAVCHLAFVLDPHVPDHLAHRVNVEGSLGLLKAAERARLSRVVLASSISAYGALPDNPRRLTEEHPLRARPDFRYAFHKALMENLADGFAARRARPSIVRLRISTVLGPPPRPGTADDILRAPVLPLPSSFRVQFVHVSDVAEAFVLALQERAQGAYNIAASVPLSAKDICLVTGQRHLALPPSLLRLGSRLLANSPLADPGRLAFLANPLIVDTRRMEDELGWLPQFDGVESLRSLFSSPEPALINPLPL